MLTIELRTMDMKEVIELWETDKRKLKIKLLDDYHDLVKEYRKQIKIYNQEGYKTSDMWLNIHNCTLVNYQAELGIKEHIRDHINFTNDFAENIKIGLEIYHNMISEKCRALAYDLAERIRLKAREVEGILELLHVKVSYGKDFEKYQDKWLHEDLEEIKIQKIREAEEKEQENKELEEYINEETE